MIYIVSLNTERASDYSHLRQELFSRFDGVAHGQILLIDFPGKAWELKEIVATLIAPKDYAFVASIGEWAGKNTPNAEKWLNRLRYRERE